MKMEQKQAKGGKWPGPPGEAFTLSQDMLEDLSGDPDRPPDRPLPPAKLFWELPPL